MLSIWTTLMLGCGEKDQTVVDLSLYCGGSSANNLISDDADCDGFVATEDCDDADETSFIEESIK